MCKGRIWNTALDRAHQRREHIRLRAISPRPLQTRTASGRKGFGLLLNEALERAPVGDLIEIMAGGFTCAYLVTHSAKQLTGSTVYLDRGPNIDFLRSRPGMNGAAAFLQRVACGFGIRPELKTKQIE